MTLGAAASLPLRIVNATDVAYPVASFAADPALRPVIEPEGEIRILPPRRAVEVQVTFRPTQEGSWTGDLRLDLEPASGRPPLLVPVFGTGVSGEITLHPGRLDFGRVLVGEESVETVLARNVGPRTVEVGAFALDAGAPVAFTTVLGTSRVLPPGEEMVLEVRFRPTAVERVRAAARLASGGGGSSGSRVPLSGPIQLEGEGVSSHLVVEPPEVWLSGAAVGERHLRLVRVRNAGLASRTVEQAELVGAGPDLSVDLAVPRALGPGGWVDVGVTFVPTAPGMQRGQLVLRADVGAPVEVPITAVAAMAAAPRPRLPPARPLDFGPVTVGHDVERFARLVVEPGPDLSAGALARVEPAQAPFRLVTSLHGLESGGERRLVVAFAPTGPGAVEGVLRVGTATRALAGVGVPDPRPGLDAWPTSLDFGGLPRGRVGVRRLTVRSTGNRALEGLRASVPPPFRLMTELPGTLDAGGTFDLRVGLEDPEGTPGAVRGALRLEAEGVEALEVDLSGETRSLPVPVPAIEVRLRWMGPAQLDLHLSRPPAGPFEVPGSVSACHPSADWGVSSSSADDPWLEADWGAGPAEERIALPSWPGGLLAIDVVQERGPATEAEVEVRVQGVGVARASRVLLPSRRWAVGFLRDAALHALDGPLEPEARVLCD